MGKVFVRGCLLSAMSVFATSVVLAENPPKPGDCLITETSGDYSLFTNKCSDTINLVWFYEGACANGCSDKLVAKYHKYVPVLKDPYTMGVCYAPQEVDPGWKGTGPAACK